MTETQGTAFGILITTDDKSAAGFATASKGADAFKSKFESFGGVIQKMPEKFGKASSAMLVFQGAASQMGGKVAAAASKLTGLASIVATGGPIGIGLASLTLAISAGSAVWETYKMASENAAAAQRSLNVVLDQQKERLEAQRTAADNARKKLKDFGRDAATVAAEDMVALADASETVVASLIRQRDEMLSSVPVVAAFSAEQLGLYKNLETVIKTTTRMNEERRREAEAVVELARKEREKEEDDKRRETAKAKAIARYTDMVAAMRSEKSELEQAAKAGKITAEGYEDQIEKIEKVMAALERKTQLTKDEALAISDVRDMSIAAREAEAAQIEDSIQKQKDLIAAIDASSAARIAAIEQQAKLDEQLAKMEDDRLEERNRKRQEDAEALVQSAVAVGEAFGAELASVAAGAQTLEEAFKKLGSSLIDTMLSAIEKVIIAEAAKAAAGAASGMFSIPFIGPALAAGAAAAAFGFVKGMISLLPKAAMGGVVMGGVPGVDSVGAVVQHGEGILQRGQTSVIQRLADRLERYESGGATVGSGSTVTNVVNLNSVVPATSAESMRAVRAVMKQQARLRRLGVVG